MKQTIKQKKQLQHGLSMMDHNYRYHKIDSCDRRYWLALALTLFIFALVTV